MASNKSRVGTSTNSLMSSSPFLGGLNTELSGIVDSTDFTKDECNMMIRADGSRSRRPGVDYEEGYKFSNQQLDTSINDLAFQCIEWTDINSPDEADTYTGAPYIVCQIGGTLIFYKNLGQPFSKYQESYTLDLVSYALNPLSDDYKKERCNFTAAYGCIFVASKAIKPFYLRAAQDPDDPRLPAETLPHGTLPVSIWNSKKGRFAGYGFGEFYLNGVSVGRTTIQDWNAGAVGNCSTGPWLMCSTQYAQWWNDLPASLNQGIVAAPKYVDGTPIGWGIHTSGGDITAGNGGYVDDYIIFTAPSGSGTAFRGTQLRFHGEGMCQWNHSTETCAVDYSCTLAGGSSYQYKSQLELQIRDTHVGATDFLAVDDQPTKMSYAHLYNLLNQGWTPKLIADYYNAQSPGAFPGNNLAQQMLKDDQTSAFKPQNIINMTLGNSPASRGHEKLKYFNQERVSVSSLVQAFSNLCSELGIAFQDIVDTSFTLVDPTTPNATDAKSQVPDAKPRKPYVADLCAYAGRIFYLSGDTLLYSQVIAEDISKADQCFTEADPTSEEMSDVIETDGGLISLPEIGDGIKLAQYGQYLFIFGTRGNAYITGTANNIFTATAYSAGTLGSVPTQAPQSFVNTEFGVFYWGTTGINVLGSNEQGLAVQDISTDKILTWYGKLSNTQHKWCKGVYSSSKKKIYWFYPGDEENPRNLNKCLVYDIQRGSFAPQEIVSKIDDVDGDASDHELPEVVSGLSVKAPFKAVKEYPVIASNNTYAVQEGEYTKFIGGIDISKSGLLFRCDFSAFSDLEAGQSKVIYKLGDAVQIAVSCNSPGDYNVIHTVNGSDTPTGSWLSSEKMWIGLWPTSMSDGEIQAASTGFVGEYELPDSGYTAQNLPDLAADLINDWGSVTWTDVSSTNFADVSIYTAMLGDQTTGFSFVTESSDVFTSRWGSLESGPDQNVYEIFDDNGVAILADNPIDSEEFTFESSVLMCLDTANRKVTFGDFRNNLLKDWTAGDWSGDGYHFDSYLISHPMNATTTSQYTGRRLPDTVHTKNMPYLITYFRRTEVGELTTGDYIYPSNCQGSILWDWRTSGRYGKWSSPTELYRPVRKTILDNGYIVNKTNIRGLGKAYQIKLESVEGSQFILEGLVFDLKNDGRI